MLWIYSHYKYFYSYSAGIDFRYQNLMSTDISMLLLTCTFNWKILHLNHKFDLIHATIELVNPWTVTTI